MNENIVDFLMYSNLGKNTFYKGSYANNELDSYKIRISNLNKSKCIGFICNTLNRDESHKTGHWVGLSVKIDSGIKNINVKFIDSYKLPHVLYGGNIVKYISKLRVMAMDYNVKFILEEIPFRLQGLKSSTCGMYCIYGLTHLAKCNSVSLKSIFSKFNKINFRKNDSEMVKYAIRIWPRNFCSDIFNSKKGVNFCPKKIFKSHKCLNICRCGKNCTSNNSTKQYISTHVKHYLI